MCAMHNPDVLLCLANLSNDEVFTPPNVANAMLDLLPETLWSDPNATFLDPCCKSGVFLREIAKRLIKGLETQIPDLETRLNHIFKKQLFGIAITELTALLSRRSVYCSKYANSKWSVASFDTPEGNIAFPQLKHTWDGNRCRYCGASKEVFESRKESHAYAFIHNVNPEELFKMKFDVIIGNPPYQLGDGSGGSTDSAIPIYNKFIDVAKRMNPHYLLMITPSKWMIGGRNLEQFRVNMCGDKRIKVIYDYSKSNDCFPGVHIDGGVSYFLWDKNHHGMVDYTYITSNNLKIKQVCYLENPFFKYVIRDARINMLLKHTSGSQSFSSIVSSVRPYGIRGYLFNEPERYPEGNLQEQPYSGAYKIYGVKGIKGGARRQIGYVDPKIVTSNMENVGKYKLFFTTSYSTGAIQFPEIIRGMPNEICTETFLQVGPFNTKEEQENCLSYMHTNFFKVLLYFGKGSMHVTKSVFQLVPMQDFSKAWTDEELYKKYGLTEEEIAFIESMIRPMEVKGDA